MGDIIEFPTKLVRDKQAWEKHIKKIISALNAKVSLPEEANDLISKRLLAICLNAQSSFDFQFSLNIPNSVSLSDRESIESSLKMSIDALRESFTNSYENLIIDIIGKHMNSEAQLCLFELGIIKGEY